MKGGNEVLNQSRNSFSRLLWPTDLHDVAFFCLCSRLIFAAFVLIRFTLRGFPDTPVIQYGQLIMVTSVYCLATVVVHWKAKGKTGNAHSQRYLLLCITDILFTSFYCILSSDMNSDLQLGYALPLFSTILFRRTLYTILVVLLLWAGMTLSSVTIHHIYIAPNPFHFSTDLLPKIAFWTVCVLPIQWLRKLIQAVQTSTHILHLLTEYMPYATFQKDRRRRFTHVNRKLLSDLNRKKGSLLGKRDEDLALFHRETLEAYKSSDELALSGTDVVEAIEPHYIPALARGNKIRTLKVPIRDITGEITGLQGFCYDLFAEEDRLFFKSLAELSPHCIFRKDRQGRFVYVNKRFCDSADRAESEILQMTDIDLYPAEHASKYRAVDAKLLSGELQSHRDEELHFFQTLGAARWVHIEKVPVKNSSGEIVGVQGAFWDVQNSRDETERILKWFLHDISKPLDVIRENTFPFVSSRLSRLKRLLPGTVDENGKGLQLIADADAQIQAAHTAIDVVRAQFRAFGVINISAPRNRLVLSTDSFSVPSLLKEISAILMRDYPVPLAIVCHPPDLDVEFDRHVFIAISWIFCDNAIKAMRKRQKETLTTDPCYRPALRITCSRVTHKKSQASPVLILSVHDNGIGFSPDQRAKMGEFGFSQFGSTGFGLQITRHLAQMIDGKYEFRSKGHLQGSTFIFQFPLPPTQ